MKLKRVSRKLLLKRNRL